MYRLLIVLFTTLVFFSCKSGAERGDIIENYYYYEGFLEIQPEKFVRFGLEYMPFGSFFVLVNGEERIELRDVNWEGDSVEIAMHVFDTRLKFLMNDFSLDGYWIKDYAEDYVVPFKAILQNTEDVDKVDFQHVSGQYQLTFLTKEGVERPAIALIDANENKLSGTVMTRTGDYRFLHGKIDADGQFYLSTFNGENAYLFEGKVNENGVLTGDFYSGISRHEKFSAEKNDTVQLEDPTQLAASDGLGKKVDFTAFELNGDTFRLSLSNYVGKPLIVQILGTWCPNCMDETAFLMQWRKQNSDAEVEVLGVAFELKDELSYAAKLLNNFIKKYEVDYTIVFAGKAGKESVNSFFPMIDGVVAYPTTIYLNRNHEIVKIYTGFSGPASGVYYENFKADFEKTIQSIQSH
jgi:thiol-disulfide isomerase/thioredoxin